MVVAISSQLMRPGYGILHSGWLCNIYIGLSFPWRYVVLVGREPHTCGCFVCLFVYELFSLLVYLFMNGLCTRLAGRTLHLKCTEDAPPITDLWLLSPLPGVWNDIPPRELLWAWRRAALWDPLSRLQGNALCQLPETCHWYVCVCVCVCVCVLLDFVS